MTDSKGQGTMSTSAEPGCDGDNNNYGFSNIERMRFRTMTYEIIEELRMRRDQDVENERKIQHLLQDKFELGKKLDVELAKLANKEEQHDVELRETRRQMEDKIREFKIDASQQQVARKIAEKENEALKDEIRKLQLTNYALQKQIRDHERHEKVQTSEREQHIRQMSQFESQFKQMTSLTKEVGTKQMKLEKDMKEIQQLNHLLRYQNHHNKCIVKLKNGDIARLQDQMVSSAVSEKASVRGEKEKERELIREISLLKEKLVNTQKQYEELAEDAESWKIKYWDSLKTLEEAHRLVNVNLHNSAQYRRECETAEEVNKATVERLERMESELTEVRGQLERVRGEREKAEEEWRNKKCELEDEIKTLNDELVSEREKYSNLETVNTQANENISELNKELENVKAILNRERCEFSTQTELSLLCVTDKNIQTCLEVTNKEIQTDTKEIACCYVQTINPALYSSEAQTDETQLTQTEAQTDNAETVSRESQTDIQLKDVLEISKQEAELATKIIQTDSPDVVHQFIQTEPPESEITIDLFTASELPPEESNLTTKQRESLPIAEIQTLKDQNRDNETKFTADQVAPGLVSDCKEINDLDFNERVVVSDLEGTYPEKVHADVGISVRDMNIRTTGTDHVIVDPEEYALTLTQDQPTTELDTDKCDAEVTEILIGQYKQDDGVTRHMNGQENKADYETQDMMICESDEDDFVAPTQPSKRLKKCRDDKVETTPGLLKHKLSLSERMRKSFGDISMVAIKENEAECSAAKQFKYSDKEPKNLGNDNVVTANEITDQSLNTDPFPTEMNRLVARSGQKLETTITPTKGTSQNLNETLSNIVRSESSFRERNMPSRIPRTKEDRSNCLHSEQSKPLTSAFPAASKQNQGKLSATSVQLCHHENPDLPLNSCIRSEPTITQSKLFVGSVRSQSCVSTVSASSSNSEASLVASRSSVLQPSRFVSSSVTTSTSVLPMSTTQSGFDSSNASSVAVPVVSSAKYSFTSSSLTVSSSTSSSAASSTEPPRSLVSTVPAAGVDSGPTFLQKYREIVSKIKPVAALQPQSTKKPGTTKKGKHLYTGSLTATMLPTPYSAVPEESANQFSADSLTTRNSLRGILKGIVNKQASP